MGQMEYRQLRLTRVVALFHSDWGKGKELRPAGNTVRCRVVFHRGLPVTVRILGIPVIYPATELQAF